MWSLLITRRRRWAADYCTPVRSPASSKPGRNAEPEGPRLKRRHLIALCEAEWVYEGESVRPHIANVADVQRQGESSKVEPCVGIHDEIVSLGNVQELPDSQRRFADIAHG